MLQSQGKDFSSRSRRKRHGLDKPEGIWTPSSLRELPPEVRKTCDMADAYLSPYNIVYLVVFACFCLLLLYYFVVLLLLFGWENPTYDCGDIYIYNITYSILPQSQ